MHTAGTDSKAAKWHSEISYRTAGAGPNATCRNEARTMAQLKKWERRASRRAAKADLRARLGE